MKKISISIYLIVFVLLTSCNDVTSSSSLVNTSSSSTTSQSSLSSNSSSSSSSSSSASTINLLDESKQEGLLELETYLESFNEEDYSGENWASLLAVFEAGKITIEVATSIPEILSAVSNAKSSIEAVMHLPINISVIDVRVYDNEYINVFINTKISKLSNLLPISNLSCTLGALEIQTIEEIGDRTSITLKGAALNLSKNEFTVTMDISAMDATISSVSFTVFHGILKTLENFRNHAISEIDNYVLLKEFTTDKYSQDNWTQLQTYIQDGKDAINGSTEYNEIISITLETKFNMAGVEQIAVDLAMFKEAAKNELVAYATAKDKNLFNPINWSKIENHLSMGKVKINLETTQRGVVVTLHTYMTKIDEVEKVYKQTITDILEVTPYASQFVRITFPSFPFKTTYEITATYNGRNARIHEMYAYATQWSAVIINVSGEDLTGGTYTLTVTFLDGTTAYTSTMQITNGVWIR